MVRWAGLGVVVAEAEAEVRAAADLVVERARLGELFVALARDASRRSESAGVAPERSRDKAKAASGGLDAAFVGA